MMGQLNSANSLIRIYSRMIMCSFLVITTVATFLFADIAPALVTMCTTMFYIFIFRCYQDKSSPGFVYYAFLAIGLASVFWVQMLYYLPLLWIIVATNLLAMTFRNFVASILGVITPYWFLVGWYAFNDNLVGFAEHFAGLADFCMPFDLSLLTVHQAVTLAFVVVLAITGILHFVNKSHQDNIRTRLFYEIFITVDVVTMVFILLQPAQMPYLYGILAINTAPLIGHFIALTHTKWTNLYFKFIVVVAAVLCIYNIWIP